MEVNEVTKAFSSLSPETRLKEFELLIEYGSDGSISGNFAEELKIPDNTLSSHLSHMNRATLVTSKKAGRSITYFAETDLIELLTGYLQANCCVRSKSTNKRCNEGKC